MAYRTLPSPGAAPEAVLLPPDEWFGARAGHERPGALTRFSLGLLLLIPLGMSLVAGRGTVEHVVAGLLAVIGFYAPMAVVVGALRAAGGARTTVLWRPSALSSTVCHVAVPGPRPGPSAAVTLDGSPTGLRVVQATLLTPFLVVIAPAVIGAVLAPGGRASTPADATPHPVPLLAPLAVALGVGVLASLVPTLTALASLRGLRETRAVALAFDGEAVSLPPVTGPVGVAAADRWVQQSDDPGAVRTVEHALVLATTTQLGRLHLATSVALLGLDPVVVLPPVAEPRGTTGAVASALLELQAGLPREALERLADLRLPPSTESSAKVIRIAAHLALDDRDAARRLLDDVPPSVALTDPYPALALAAGLGSAWYDRVELALQHRPVGHVATALTLLDPERARGWAGERGRAAANSVVWTLTGAGRTEALQAWVPWAEAVLAEPAPEDLWGVAVRDTAGFALVTLGREEGRAAMVPPPDAPTAQARAFLLDGGPRPSRELLVDVFDSATRRLLVRALTT